jgi:hypothetical protein
MTYLLKLREDANVPPMTITITSHSSQHESPREWRAHLQYDDSSRQASAVFYTPPKQGFLAIFAAAMEALDATFR